MAHPKTLLAALCLAVPLAAVGGGCSSGGGDDSGSGGAGNTCPFDYGDYTPTSDPSFANDVMPVIQRACNLSTCHGSSLPKGDLFMGPSLFSMGMMVTPDQATIDMVLTEELINIPSATAPAVMLVMPGSPENSFMMTKIDGCQNVRGFTCTAQGGAVTNGVCGDDMPQSQPPLPDSEKNMIRDWIAQGAKNN